MSAISAAGTQTLAVHRDLLAPQASAGNRSEEATESPAAKAAEQSRASSGSRVDVYG